MKILVVSPKFYPVVGGGETFVLHSMEQLYIAGHDVSIAVEPHHDRRLEIFPYGVYEIEGLSDVRLDTVMAADGLYKLIKQLKPEIIHVHGYFGLLAIALANINNIPIIVSIHSTPVWGERIIGGMSSFKQELFYTKQIIALAKPKIMTAANDVYARAAKKINHTLTNIQVFPYPLLSSYFEEHDRNKYREELRLCSDDVLITVPSRIVERKGIREAVEALSFLPKEYKLCLPCAVAPLDKRYWTSIVKGKAFKNVKNRIIIPELPILPSQMPDLYAATDVVVMPSYYEGAPVATVESMASRKPFVGTDCQGINGFISSGKNGLLVSPKSVQPLANAIQNIWDDKELQKRCVVQAYNNVRKIDWKYQLPVLIELYKSLQQS